MNKKKKEKIPVTEKEMKNKLNIFELLVLLFATLQLWKQSWSRISVYSDWHAGMTTSSTKNETTNKDKLCDFWLKLNESGQDRQ